MDYRAVGGTGVKVSHLCLGAMMFGPNRPGNSRRWAQLACDASLRRLGTDWIDIYQVHRPDPAVDPDETLGALSDLVHAGKVRYIGSSTFPSAAVVEVQWVAERRGRERFVCEQPPYSIFARGVEADVLPTCARHRMGVIAWSPLNGGWLTGKYRRGQDPPADSRGARNWAGRFEGPGADRKLDLVEELLTLAADAGVSLTHLAQAWVVNHPAVTSAIIGPRTTEHLADLLAGQDVRLDAPTLDRVDALVAPGTNVHDGDAGWTSPALDPAARRRP